MTLCCRCNPDSELPYGYGNMCRDCREDYVRALDGEDLPKYKRE